VARPPSAFARGQKDDAALGGGHWPEDPRIAARRAFRQRDDATKARGARGCREPGESQKELGAIGGIGRFYVAAVSARDYPLVLGLTIVLAASVILANLVVDLIHGWLDPRVREHMA